MGLASLCWAVAILFRMRRCAAGWLSIQSKTISPCKRGTKCFTWSTDLIEVVTAWALRVRLTAPLRIEGVGMRLIEAYPSFRP
jgi:hypothetical protein